MLFVVGDCCRLDRLALQTVLHAVRPISSVQPALQSMVALVHFPFEPSGWTLDDGLLGNLARQCGGRLLQRQRRMQLCLGFPDSAEHSLLPKFFCPRIGLEYCLDSGYDRYCNSPYGGCCFLLFSFSKHYISLIIIFVTFL